MMWKYSDEERYIIYEQFSGKYIYVCVCLLLHLAATGKMNDAEYIMKLLILCRTDHYLCEEN